MIHRLTAVSFLLIALLAGTLWAGEDADEESDFFEELLGFPFGTVQEFEKALEEHIFNLGEVRVSGGRITTPLSGTSATSLPHNTTFIGRKEIQENNVGSLAEILSQKEGITYSDETGLGLNARVDLRGFGGEGKQALVLFDGLRAVEPFDNSVVWHLYPMEFIDKVEIQRGGASTIYGEGAFSGVIQLKTKRPTETLRISTESQWGDYDTEKYYVDASGKAGNLGFYAGGYYLTTSGYRTNSDHEGANLLLKGEWAVTDLVLLKNNFHFADHETGIPGPLTQAEVDENRRQPDPESQPGDQFSDKLIENGFGLSYLLDDDGMEMTYLFGYRFRRQGSMQSFGGLFGGTSMNDIETETLSNILQGTWVLEKDLFRSSVIGGLEWSKDDIYNPFEFRSFSFGPFSAERSIDRRMMGSFIQHLFEIKDRWIFESGLRWDKIDWEIYDLKSPHLQKRKKTDSLSPKAGAEFRIRDPLSIYASYSESFKGPDANTLIFETPNLFTPNPDIDPQVAKHFEVGIRYAHPSYGSVRADLFYIETKKEILFNDISNLNENFDTQRRGLEVASEIKFTNDLEAFANFTYAEAEFDNGDFDGKSIPLVPQSKWSAGFLLSPAKHWNISVQATGVYDQFALNDFENIFQVEDYWILGGKIAYHRDSWEIYIRLQNLWGEEYSSFVSSNGVDTLHFNPSPTCSMTGGFRMEI